MIIWSVVAKLDKEIKEEYPFLTEEEHAAMGLLMSIGGLNM